VPLETVGGSQFGKPAELDSSKSSQRDGEGLMLAQNGPPEEEPDDEPLLEPELEPESPGTPASDEPLDRDPTFKHPDHVTAAKRTSDAFDFRTAPESSTFTRRSRPIVVPVG
jgi:hypothetical protein